MEARLPARYDFDDLDRIVNSESARPPGISVGTLGPKEYKYLAPGSTEPIRVTTDPDFYQEHTESVELWSPGNPLFPNPADVAAQEELPKNCSVDSLLDGSVHVVGAKG